MCVCDCECLYEVGVLLCVCVCVIVSVWVCWQIVLENYVFPGVLVIGTDSHTPNGGE